MQYYQKSNAVNGIGIKTKKAAGMELDDKNLTKAEREKILEVLMS